MGILAKKQGLKKILTVFRMGLFKAPYGWGQEKRKNFLQVLKGCFDKHGFNFDDVTKIGHSIPSENEDILKQRLWPHNFSLGRHQKFFSLDSNYTVDVVMWADFGISSISMREVIITSIL